MDAYVLGVDGCRAGWLTCALPIDRDSQIKPIFEVHPDVDALWEAHKDAASVLIDIPIGLAPSGLRDCDLAAKKLLGKYNSRVFLTPPRSVFERENYEEANAHCREVCEGRGLMKQLWAIAPKIREVDVFLRENEAARGVVRECHPEICFLGLSGEIIPDNKKTEEGYEKRAAILEEEVPHVSAMIDAQLMKFPRKVVARDDVVDAYVGAVTARAIAGDPAREKTLPDSPPTDEQGIAMEMVFSAKSRD